MNLNWRKRTCILITLIVPAMVVICINLHANENSFLYKITNPKALDQTDSETNAHAEEGDNKELTEDLLILLQKNG